MAQPTFNSDDCAVVIRADGTVSVYYPDVEQLGYVPNNLLYLKAILDACAKHSDFKFDKDIDTELGLLPADRVLH